MYNVFARSWYKPNGSPNVGGRKTIVRKSLTYAEAQQFCTTHNLTRSQAWVKVSRKYEFERQ